MELIDGNLIARQILTELKSTVEKISPRAIPHIVVIRVGDQLSYLAIAFLRCKDMSIISNWQIFQDFSQKNLSNDYYTCNKNHQKTCEVEDCFHISVFTFHLANVYVIV